jgi:hypothetical protein
MWLARLPPPATLMPVLLAASLSAEAQQTNNVHRIAVLSPADPVALGLNIPPSMLARAAEAIQ